MTPPLSHEALETPGAKLRLLSWDEADPDEWVAFLSACPEATFFHTPEWMSLLVRSFSHWRGYVLLAEDATKGWQALLPFVEARHLGVRTLLSMPFGTFGGIVAPEGCPRATLTEMCSGLLRRLPAWMSRGLLITEHHSHAMGCLSEEATRRFEIVTRTTQILDLAGGLDDVWRERFEPQRRRQTRSSRRRGLVVRRAESLPDFLAYFDLFRNVSMGWKSHIRLPSLLFQNMCRLHSSHIHLWIAEHEGDVVGGNLFFSYRDQAISWNAVMLRSHVWLHPAVALHHASIEDAYASGCRQYHFGPSLSLRNVERFKQQFGCDVSEYRIWAVLTPLGRVLERFRPAIRRACSEEARSEEAEI